MRKRVLQVKMVKNEKEEPTSPDDPDNFYKKAAFIGDYLENAFGSIGKAVLIYIAADTVRQVMVAKASK